MSRIIDLTGQRFGKYTVIKRDETKPKGKTCKVYWICQCDCGREIITSAYTLKIGKCNSCGCLISK